MGSENVDPRTRLPGSAGAGGILLDAEGGSEGTGPVETETSTPAWGTLPSWPRQQGLEGKSSGRPVSGVGPVIAFGCVWRTVEPRPREHL